MLPLLYPVVYLIWFLIRKEWFAKRIRNVLRHLLYSSEQVAAGGIDNRLLPHRIVQPEDYEILSESHHDETEDHGTTDEQAPLLNQHGSCQ